MPGKDGKEKAQKIGYADRVFIEVSDQVDIFFEREEKRILDLQKLAKRMATEDLAKKRPSNLRPQKTKKAEKEDVARKFEHLKELQERQLNDELSKLRDKLEAKIFIAIGRSGLDKIQYYDAVKDFISNISIEKYNIFVNEINEYGFLNALDHLGVLYLDKFEARPTAPPQLEEDTPDNIEALRPIFEGSLNRTDLAEALKLVRKANKLTQRAAAEAAHTSHTDIKRVENGTSSLDKSTEILNELGFDVRIQLVPKNPSE
ncbi:helix-turn-helix domain-containing protein [Rhodobacterales bacterium]|nr:helix-turn-helix domain-containing protein [Rhodobacterales bacterium]